jgi:hypothetical protein
LSFPLNKSVKAGIVLKIEYKSIFFTKNSFIISFSIYR